VEVKLRQGDAIRPGILGAATLGIAAWLVSSWACSSDAKPALSELAQRGRTTYLSVCIACHNTDPNKDGSLGPAVAGSSRALLEAKVIHGTYPPGYAPKRSSNAMPAQPHLADQIDALHAYLSEVAE
jgi:mono/diheme cytochrome c family protein